MEAIHINDIINGCFEIGSGLISLINIFKLIKDKSLKGISWIPMVFFTMWGGWNLYYYPSLNQMVSFIGGLLIFIINIVWLLLLMYFNMQRKSHIVLLITDKEGNTKAYENGKEVPIINSER